MAPAVLLGAHVPTAGGLHRAHDNGQAIGATAIQIFTRNKMQWQVAPLGPEEVAAFRNELLASGVRAVLSHASYLINLASPNPDFLGKSRDAMVAELVRCDALGIPHAVVHPGAHMGEGESAGLRAVAASLDEVLQRTDGLQAGLLLEVTAGQGTCLGHRFEHLAEILARVRRPERLGICLDTCHLYAADYDLATPRGYEATLRAFEDVLGLPRLKAVHLNDSKTARGSRVDRHARAGEGTLGLATFRRLLADPRLAGVPKVLETPGPLEAWKAELALLRGLLTRPKKRSDAATAGRRGRRRPAGRAATVRVR
jgi:deoxyribonuclease IV